jgi:hypothetical protein
VAIESPTIMDDLATGMADGTITRGKAIKLAGAALLGSVLGVFAAVDEADAQDRCRRRDVQCVVRRGGRRRVFCCPRAVVNVSSCRTAILGDLCIRIG